MQHRGMEPWQMPARSVLLYAEHEDHAEQVQKARWQWAAAELLAEEQEVRKMKRKAKRQGGRL